VSKRDCPDYSKVISNPMDLSTIKINITSGKYVETIKESKANENKTIAPAGNVSEEATCNLWDEIILSTLKHIEIMYHNCKLYNTKGTTVSRMCDVQMVHYLQLREKNIEADLTDQVKKSLEEFVLENQERRKKQSILPKASGLPYFVSVASKETFTPSSSEDPIVVRKVNSKLPVATAATRSIIIIEPDTNTIVRYYSTQKLAMKACFQMVDKGYQVGISPLTDYQWRKIMKAANLDASVLMFGYRWLVYEDVLNGQVVFPGFVDRIYRDETLIDGITVQSGKVGLETVKEDCDGVQKLFDPIKADRRNLVLRERSGSRRSSNPNKQKQADLPEPKETHCHAYISQRKLYCKRKIVDGSNYCMIHMKQMMQGNVANGVIFVSEMKGSLPSGRRKYARQAGHKPNSIIVDGKVNSTGALEAGSDLSDENNNDPVICTMLEMPLIQNMCIEYSHGHIDAVAESIFSLTAAINTTSAAVLSTTRTQNSSSSVQAKVPKDSILNGGEVVLPEEELFISESSREMNDFSFEIPEIPSLPPIALPVPICSSEAIIAISLSTQTVMGRWNSVYSASNDVGISSTKLRRIIDEKEPLGDIFYSEASHEHGILAKLREIVERQKSRCTTAI